MNDTIVLGGDWDGDLQIDGSATEFIRIEKNVQVALNPGRVSTLVPSDVPFQKLEVAKAGTYDVYWSGFRTAGGSGFGAQLFIDGKAYGAMELQFVNNAQGARRLGVALSKGQTLTVRGTVGNNTGEFMYVTNLTIIER